MNLLINSSSTWGVPVEMYSDLASGLSEWYLSSLSVLMSSQQLLTLPLTLTSSGGFWCLQSSGMVSWLSVPISKSLLVHSQLTLNVSCHSLFYLWHCHNIDISLGSAVAVEWIFSGGRDTISLCRASLKPETIHTLMLVKQCLHLTQEAVKDIVGC